MATTFLLHVNSIHGIITYTPSLHTLAKGLKTSSLFPKTHIASSRSQYPLQLYSLNIVVPQLSLPIASHPFTHYKHHNDLLSV